MDRQEKASWETWATRLLSAASVLTLVYFGLFVDFTNHGRLWDRLAARVPALAKIVPPAPSADSMTGFTKSAVSAEDSPSVDRTLIVAEKAPAAASRPQAAAPAAAAAPAQAAQRQTPVPHLTSSLTPFNILDNSQSARIMVPGSAGQKGAQQSAQAAAAPSAAAPSQGAAAPAVAAKTSYGATSRSEMMGQAAGPVFNLTGRK